MMGGHIGGPVGIVAGLLLLCVLIVIHELGHFWAAKALGVRVLTFSVGFGPKLLKFSRGETEYCLSAIPLGGYVRMLGESPDEVLSEEDQKRSFLGQPIWKKSLIAFAGPFFNLILPVFIFFALSLGTQEIWKPVIGQVIEGHVAQKAGMMPGDLIVSIDQKPIESFAQVIQEVASHPGQLLHFEVLRQGEKKTFDVMTEATEDPNPLNREKKIGRIGVMMTDPPEVTQIQVGPLGAMKIACESTWSMLKMTVFSVWMLIRAEVSPKELGGPLAIIGVASQAASQGITYFLHLMALISVNLGLLNLLPVPILDGGHLTFFGIEAITRRPISMRIRQVLSQAGLVLLLGLMMMALFNDIVRLWNPK